MPNRSSLGYFFLDEAKSLNQEGFPTTNMPKVERDQSISGASEYTKRMNGAKA
jgi:hypothetical protein